MPRLKSILIVALLVVLGLGGFAASLYYSYTQISWTYGETTITRDIHYSLDTSTRTIYVTGTVALHTPITVSNAGIYDIKNLIVDVDIYIISSQYGPALAGRLIGHGHNIVGDIPAGQSIDSVINVELDSRYLPYIAFYDNHVKTTITISCTYFVVPFTYTTSAEWDLSKFQSLPAGFHVPPPP
jgi:hypothetical protein